jgi:hypothetical protein
MGDFEKWIYIVEVYLPDSDNVNWRRLECCGVYIRASAEVESAIVVIFIQVGQRFLNILETNAGLQFFVDVILVYIGFFVFGGRLRLRVNISTSTA